MRKPCAYNIGLGYIASSLIEDGHKVKVLDIEGYRYPKSRVIDLLRKTEFDAVGIGTLITGYKYVKWIIKKIKELKPQIPIWIGNSIASTIPELILDDIKEIDVVVIGEGENTIKELAKITEQHGDLSNIRGICFRKEGKIIRTPERELIEDIDRISFPAWDLFPQNIHMHNKTGILPSPTAYIITARGCPYHCTYCYHPFQNQKIRFHSAKRIIEEIKLLISKYGIKSVLFADDLFVTNKKRVYEICDLLEQEKIKIQWMAAGRVNLVDKELLKRMQHAGCKIIGFGIESGSQQILDNIKKQATVEQAIRAIQLCQESGILPACSFMIGNIGETSRTVAQSVSFILNYVPHLAGFFITTPYPCTELYQYALEHGKIPNQIKLFESYGEQSDKLLVNFTEMSDGELLRLKKKAEGIIQKNYDRKHPIQKLTKILKRGKNFLLLILTGKYDWKKIVTRSKQIIKNFRYLIKI